MEGLESDIFGGKKFKDLLQEIYENQKKKEKQISTLINELKPMIENIGDATLIVPLLKEYLEIGVKNDEQLIKMATIIQRCLNTGGGGNAGDSAGISDAEKQQILGEIKNLHDKNKSE